MAFVLLIHAHVFLAFKHHLVAVNLTLYPIVRGRIGQTSKIEVIAVNSRINDTRIILLTRIHKVKLKLHFVRRCRRNTRLILYLGPSLIVVAETCPFAGTIAKSKNHAIVQIVNANKRVVTKDIIDGLRSFVKVKRCTLGIYPTTVKIEEFHNTRRIAIIVHSFLSHIFLWEDKLNGITFSLLTFHPSVGRNSADDILNIHLTVVCFDITLNSAVGCRRIHTVEESHEALASTIKIVVQGSLWLFGDNVSIAGSLLHACQHCCLIADWRHDNIHRLARRLVLHRPVCRKWLCKRHCCKRCCRKRHI